MLKFKKLILEIVKLVNDKGELAYMNAVLPRNIVWKICCSCTYTFQQNAVRSHNYRIPMNYYFFMQK